MEEAPVKVQKEEKSAGTKPLVFAEHGRYVVKLGSAREQFVYRNTEELGLGGVMPNYYKPVGYHWTSGLFSKSITAVDVMMGDKKVTLTLDAPLQEPSGGQKIIVIDKLGGGVKSEGSFSIDIKIGTYTKSGEQFNLEGASGAWRLVKWVEHDRKDASRGNRESGIDMDQKGKAKFETAVWAQATGKSNGWIKTAIAHIQADIVRIQKAVANPKIAFVGSSVLCYFDPNNPERSEAKLIDPDHPIVLEDVGEGVPKDVMTESNFAKSQKGKWVMSTREWDEYKDKWSGAFQYGLQSLYEYFDGIDQRI